MPVIRSLCGQCSVGCGVRAVTGADRDAVIDGDRTHPANGGRLCERGRALVADADMDGRLLHPQVDGRPVGWDRAIAHVARRLSGIIARHGSGSVAVHVAGDLLTEDYYVINKLMKGFVGSAHIQFAHGMGQAVADAHRAAFGEDVMPAAHEDIDRAAMILMVGAGIAMDQPVLFDRIRHAREELGAQLVLLDGDRVGGRPSEVPECDLHLSVRPGSETLLLNGLLLHCLEVGAVDADFLADHVAVPPDFWADLRSGHDVWSVARACDLPPAVIRAFFDHFAATPQVVTLFAPAGRGDEAGILTAAILNLHLATGRMGKPGATPFAIATAPNGMGSREVGCRHDMLAAHRDYAPGALADVALFWGAGAMAPGPGLAGDALLQAMRDGQVKALWSIGGTVAGDAWLREAMAQLPFVVRSADRPDATIARAADVLLPSACRVEKDGTMTGTDRLISRQRRLFALPGEARPDWWIVTQVARAMGWHEAFHYERPAEIYREHARLTAYRNAGARLLDLRRHAPISNPAYEELTPWRWGEVPFDGGHFPTPDGRARLVRSWDEGSIRLD